MEKRGCKPRGLAAAIIFLSLLLACFDAHAFGVATPYLDNDTIKLEAGQRYIYNITVQNNDDTGYYVNITYNSDGNVFRLIEKDMYVTPKSFDNVFSFEVQVPDNARPGKLYSFSFSVRPLLNASGQVPVSVQISRSARVLVVDRNGIGYRENVFDSIGNALSGLESYVIYFLIPIVLIVLIFVITRLWRTSRNISRSIIQNQGSGGNEHDESFPGEESHPEFVELPAHEEPEPARKPVKKGRDRYSVAGAKSVKELKAILVKMPADVFRLEQVKQMLSGKLIELGKPAQAKKILSAESKQDALKVLR